MSVCPHTDNADKCTCKPGCGCEREPHATGIDALNARVSEIPESDRTEVDTFDRTGTLGPAWVAGDGNVDWSNMGGSDLQVISVQRDQSPTFDHLRLYGRMPIGSGPNDPEVGAILTANSRCTRCGGRFLERHALTAHLEPNMAGTAHHMDCDDPTLENSDEDGMPK